ncbi:MAG: hypothetical protein ACXABY_12405 [Candidatus Thorarchaeota archaeon]|jgi:hypothetical protein
MPLRCPACQSKEFYVVVERNWSFRVESVGFSDVAASNLEDEISGKSLVCDDCGFNGWVDEYHLAKSGVITLISDESDE